MALQSKKWSSSLLGCLHDLLRTMLRSQAAQESAEAAFVFREEGKAMGSCHSCQLKDRFLGGSKMISNDLKWDFC